MWVFFVCLNSGFKPLPCEEEAIGIEAGRIEDSKMTSNSSAQGYEAYNGRLNHEHASWCGSSTLPSYTEVDLNMTYIVCAVATQGISGNLNSFVEEYKMEFSLDGFKWDFYHNKTGVKVRIVNIGA